MPSVASQSIVGPTETQYSRLREIILSKLSSSAEHVPVEWEDKAHEDLVSSLGLSSIIRVKILTIPQKVELQRVIDGLYKESQEQVLRYDFNGNIAAVCWIVANGLVDDNGDYLMSGDDVVSFSGKFESIIYSLAWQVLYVNQIFKKNKLVGNSEGTDISTDSSEQPVI